MTASENGRLPEGIPTVAEQRASVAAVTEKDSDATGYAEPPERVMPSYDDRRDWYSRGLYSADCAPADDLPLPDALGPDPEAESDDTLGDVLWHLGDDIDGEPRDTGDDLQ